MRRLRDWARDRHRLLKLAIQVGVLLVIMSTVGAVGFIEFSGQPGFCKKCHIMEPYYESWKESRHGMVACVECHIPPGVTAEFRKKYEALSMVASYFTGTYRTNPWTEIDYAACLRCHVSICKLRR